MHGMHVFMVCAYVCIRILCMQIFLCLFSVINSTSLENEETRRSDVTEKLIMGSSYEQQNSKDHVLQETTEIGLPKQSHLLVELNNVVMPHVQQMYMVDTTRSASSTCVVTKRYSHICEWACNNRAQLTAHELELTF